MTIIEKINAEIRYTYPQARFGPVTDTRFGVRYRVMIEFDVGDLAVWVSLSKRHVLTNFDSSSRDHRAVVGESVRNARDDIAHALAERREVTR